MRISVDRIFATFFVFAYYLGYMRIRLQSLIIILVISISEFL